MEKDRDNLILFLLNFYCSQTDIEDKYTDIVGFLKDKGIINSNTENWIVPKILHTEKSDIILKPHLILNNSLGHGSYGTIFGVYNKLDQQEYALKVVENEEKMDEDKFLREIRYLAKFDHPNIIRYYTSWVGQNKLYYLMELCDTNLTSLIEKRDTINDYENCSIFKQIGLGIRYLHNKGIIHRDITTNNILLKYDKKLIVKIADFGISIKKENPKQLTMGSDEYGTISYLAPECLNSNMYSVYTDYYSLGILLYLLYTNFNTQMEKYKSLESLKSKGKVDDTLKNNYPDIVKIILGLIDTDPLKRTLI